MDTPEPHDTRAATGDQARAWNDATWAGRNDHGGQQGDSRRRAPVGGLFSADLGPKSEIAARTRQLSRLEQRAGVRVSQGSSIRGMGVLILLMVAVVATVCMSLLALIYWAVS